jgi:hypothetical protein
MATTKRSTKGRAKARRATTPARSRAAKKTAPAPKKKSAARAGTKASAKVKPARPSAAKQAAKKPGGESSELVALRAKAQREKSGLEKRLTEAAREIGLLRHHELRAMQLERQLAEREATIQRLQTQLADLERRPSEPVYVREVQQSLALGSPARDADADVTDVDEFEDDRRDDDPDFLGDEE